MATETDDLAVTWAAFTSRLTYDDLPESVRQVTRWLALDTFGTTLAANTLGVGIPELLTWARGAGGAPEATLIGFTDKLPAVTAAMVNGGMAHALNFDDTTAVGSGHLGPVTMPCALAAAEVAGGATGKELMASLAAGAELMSRIGVAITKAESGFSEAKPQPTQMPGYFAAAVAAGRMLSFSPSQMHSALGLAFMQASGGRQPVLEGRPAKAIYAAFSCQGGMLAALLARGGLEADCAVFEGDAGFFPTYYGGRYDRPTLADGLGEEYYMTNVGFKPWPTTGVAHVFIEAAIDLATEHDLAPGDVRAVLLTGEPHIRTFCEPLATRRNPQAPVEAEDSVIFTAAKALATRNVTLTDLQPTPEGLFEAEAVRIANATDYQVDPSLGRSGIVEVTLGSGETLTRRVDAARGHRDNPLTTEQRRAKFTDCAAHAASDLSDATLREVMDMIDHLEDVPDVRAFPELLGGRRG